MAQPGQLPCLPRSRNPNFSAPQLLQPFVMTRCSNRAPERIQPRSEFPLDWRDIWARPPFALILCVCDEILFARPFASPQITLADVVAHLRLFRLVVTTNY